MTGTMGANASPAASEGASGPPRRGLPGPVVRERKSKLVRLFSKTPAGVRCPHFYELILSNGCPYGCSYCYLRLTFRGNKHPVLFSNPWEEVVRELEAVESGVFSTGELADSLAVVPPLLAPAIEYFRGQPSKYLLLTTKSCNVRLFRHLTPTPQVIVSFSVNAPEVSAELERLAPPPLARLKAAARLLEWGWRVRVRLDPVVWSGEPGGYRLICREIAALGPERVTVGTLRHYPGLFRFAPEAPRENLERAGDGRMRYPLPVRVYAYRKIAEWLGFQPALCKETDGVWDALGWKFYGCNCTV